MENSPRKTTRGKRAVNTQKNPAACIVILWTETAPLRTNLRPTRRKTGPPPGNVH